MMIFMDQAMVDMDGTVLTRQTPTGEGPYTLRAICVQALMGIFDDERGLSGEEKLARYELALRINKAEEPVELKAEDVALLKKLIAKGFATIIVGQAWKALDK